MSDLGEERITSITTKKEKEKKRRRSWEQNQF
jgi:hypothetical protein